MVANPRRGAIDWLLVLRSHVFPQSLSFGLCALEEARHVDDHPLVRSVADLLGAVEGFDAEHEPPSLDLD